MNPSDKFKKIRLRLLVFCIIYFLVYKKLIENDGKTWNNQALGVVS
jgi:hypothetical protein